MLWFAWASVYTQAIPVVVVLLGRRRQVARLSWTARWCALLLAQDLTSRIVTHVSGSNIWFGHLMVPITGVVALWMLSHWARGAFRTVLRVAIPGYLVAVVLLMVHVEDFNAFPKATLPFENLLIMVAAIVVLLQHVLTRDHDRIPTGTILALVGIVLYAAATTTFGPVFNYFQERGMMEAMRRTFMVRAAIVGLSFIVIGIGVAWTRPSKSSSSPPSSPLLYSSEPSA